MFLTSLIVRSRRAASVDKACSIRSVDFGVCVVAVFIGRAIITRGLKRQRPCLSTARDWSKTPRHGPLPGPEGVRTLVLRTPDGGVLQGPAASVDHYRR